MVIYLHRLILFFMSIWICNSSFAQKNKIFINLEKALELGDTNNLTIQEYMQRTELALANLAQSKEWWLPEAYAGIQTHQLWGAAMNGNGNFF